MKVYLVKNVQKWAKKLRVSDKKLYDAAKEVAEDNYEASLGGYLYKKRIGLILR